MRDAGDANGHSNGQANGYTNGHIMSEQNNELNAEPTNAEPTVAETAIAVVEPETSPHPATTQAPDITDASITTKSWTPQSSTRKAKKELGLKFVRHFTRAGEDPFNTVDWELRTAAITGEDGKIVFEQKDCEIPKTWSQLATNVVVSKYFRGRMDSPQRETSVRQVIGRVADTFGRWGVEGGYFASDEDASAFRDELVYLLLHQYGSFNSPVWFNIGVKGAHQQASACQPYDALVATPSGLIPIGKLVEDNAVGTLVFDARGVARIVATKCNGIKRVLRLHTKAGYILDVTGDHLVWKATGTNKGTPTGHFVEAGTLQAGDQLCWHRTPSIDKSQEMTSEAAEAALAGWLQSDGFVGQYESGTNRSLTIEAMVVNEEEERWVRALIERVLPNVHSHTRDVKTQSADLQCRRIRLYGEALRPFVEKWDLLTRREEMRVPQSLFTAPLGVAAAYLRSLFQAEGYVSVRENAVVGLDMISEGLVRDTQLLLGRFGIYARVRSKKDARDNRVGCASLSIRTLGDRERFAQEIGFLSTRKSEELVRSLELKGLRLGDAKRLEIEHIEDRGEMPVYDIQTTSGEYLSGNIRVHNCFINSVHDNMESIMELAATEARLFKGGSGAGSNLSRIRSSKEHLSGGGIASGPVSFMRGWDAFAGAIKSGGTTRRAAKMVILNADHPDIEEFVAAKSIEEKKAWALIEAGYNGGFNMPGGAYDSVDFQNANHSVRASDEFMRAADNNTEWNTHSVTTGEIVEKKNARQMLRSIAEATHICGDPGMQYDTTINDWHTSSNTDRIYASNPCSEFLYLDDTACNLASMNLMKFRQQNGEFDSELFVHASEVFITAQEIIVSNASYPTEKIAKNSEKFRPLGLGYANLGALLMAQGTAYDSDEGRALAGAITAIMTGAAYRQSAKIAANIGTFEGYKENREPMLRVIGKHRDAVSKIPRATVPIDTLNTAQRVWDEALVLGQKHGYRNAQATVLAPTGCLVESSLIATDRGLVRLKRLGDTNGQQWQDIELRVWTDEGVQQATKFYINGVAPTRVVRTQAGYSIQGTHKHRVKVVTASGAWEWKRFDAIQKGDVVPLALNTLTGEAREVVLPPLGDIYWTGDFNTRVPRTMTAELAELIGYFMGDGSLHAKSLRFCVADADTDVVERIRVLVSDLFGLAVHVSPQTGYQEVAVHSVPLTVWWEACGLSKQKPHKSHNGKGYVPHVPDCVLHANDAAIYNAFLRGLFEADGTLIEGVPSFSTAHESFAGEVRSLLLALGYPTTSKVGASGWGSRDLHSLRLRNGGYNVRFRREIGFMGARKQDAIADLKGALSGKRDRIYLPIEVIEEIVPRGTAHRDAVLLSLRRHGALPRQRVVELYAQSGDERLLQALGYFYDTVETNEDGGEQPTYDLSVPHNVTYVANGFISHNTIAFMMDCDTTGIEPDIALVKYKKLVGGGLLKIVNQTVPEALQKLGYSSTQSDAIIDYIDKNDTIEGAPGLKEEHLPVFDCAFKAQSGTRSIHYMGHIRMMAAAQPFISGAISKTVNVPSEASVDDILQAYMESWKLGLKAVAIYRDGSKRTQPLSTTTDAKIAEAKEARDAPRALRRKLPDERHSITHKFSIAGQEGYFTVGLYEDGSPGEIFIKMSKEGSTISGLMDSFAVAISMCLQYGVPLRVLVNKFSHSRFEPSGYTTNKEIPIAKSLMDYIFRWFDLRFHPNGSNGHLGKEAHVGVSGAALTTSGSSQPALMAAPDAANHNDHMMHGQLSQAQSDAPPCTECGTLMIRAGACYKCPNCGTTSGCG
jgi:ribonucleoside-diphosphate reductase alpha chain